jgi:preprotein translocase SecE subunit
MNREMKRAQRRQGTQVERAQAAAATRRAQLQQKKIWPTRQELTTYTIVVLVTVVVMTSYVFGLDVLFSRLVLNVFTN